MINAGIPYSEYIKTYSEETLIAIVEFSNNDLECKTDTSLAKNIRIKRDACKAELERRLK